MNMLIPFPHAADIPEIDPRAVRLGLAAEPIISLISPNTVVLYRECSLRLLAPSTSTLIATDVRLNTEERRRLLDMETIEFVLKALSDDPQAILGCNLSFSTLAFAPTCKRILQRILDEQHLAPRLVLGITEDWLLDEITGVSSQLAAAKLLGCRLAILPSHPVSWRSSSVNVEWDIVKIDHELFRLVRKDLRDNDELCVLMAQAAALAPTIVIDGIETQGQLEIAQAAGATHGQGTLFGGRAFNRWFVGANNISAQTISLLVHSGAVVYGKV